MNPDDDKKWSREEEEWIREEFILNSNGEWRRCLFDRYRINDISEEIFTTKSGLIKDQIRRDYDG